MLIIKPNLHMSMVRPQYYRTARWRMWTVMSTGPNRKARSLFRTPKTRASCEYFIIQMHVRGIHTFKDIGGVEWPKEK